MAVSIENDYIKCWHSSNHLFDRPWSAAGALNRLNDPSRHLNGALGIWVTLDENSSTRSAFGKYLYAAEVFAPPSRRHTISIADLQFISRINYDDAREVSEAAFYAQRNQWLDAGYSIIFIEESGLKGKDIIQGIIVDQTVIRNWRLVDTVNKG
jgi:hypothetical protein